MTLVRRHQRGAVSIEFAAVFMLFFVLVYAVIAYALPLLLALSLKHVSADAARVAVRVDPALSAAQYAAVVSRQIDLQVQQSWLPDNWYQGNCPAPGGGLNWQPLPAARDGESYGYLAVDNSQAEPARVLHVCLQRFYNRDGNAQQRAIIPVIRFLGVQIPSLAERDGQTVLRGETRLRL